MTTIKAAPPVEVASACHVSRVAVHHWEAGRTPAPIVAWKLVAAWEPGLRDAIESGLIP